MSKILSGVFFVFALLGSSLTWQIAARSNRQEEETSRPGENNVRKLEAASYRNDSRQGSSRFYAIPTTRTGKG